MVFDFCDFTAQVLKFQKDFFVERKFIDVIFIIL